MCLCVGLAGAQAIAQQEPTWTTTSNGVDVGVLPQAGPVQLPSYPNTYVDTQYVNDLDPTDLYAGLPTLPYDCPRCGAPWAWVLLDESFIDGAPWVFVNTDPSGLQGYWVCHSNAHRRVVLLCPCYHQYVVRYDGGVGADGFRYYRE